MAWRFKADRENDVVRAMKWNVGYMNFSPVHFEDIKGQVTTVQGWDGQNVLELAHSNGIPVEGACEGSLACCTCHVILPNKEDFKKFPEPSDREEDLLDTAPGLTET